MATKGAPLLVSQKALTDFNSEIGPSLLRALELGQHRYLVCTKYPAIENQQIEAYGVRDTSGHVRRVINRRRNEIEVFPFVSSGDDDVLLGVTFEWVKAGKKLRFSNAQFIVYLAERARIGQEPSRDADQLFRLEWQGRGEDGSFETSVVGHPHWQVDALPPASTARYAAPGPVTLDQLTTHDVRSVGTWMSRLHLAAAANGWAMDQGWSGDTNDCATHANSPGTIDELHAWALSAARYLNHQIGAAVI